MANDVWSCLLCYGDDAICCTKVKLHSSASNHKPADLKSESNANGTGAGEQVIKIRNFNLRDCLILY